jgi:hypothetical protein
MTNGKDLNEKGLMKFPCDFRIKIIGVQSDDFVQNILSIAQKYFPDTKDTAVRSQPSQQGNFIAITITLHVHDQETLDKLYMELTKHPDIKMVL